MPDDPQFPFGRHATSARILHVSAVPSGLACNCLCPDCGQPFVARRGTHNVHHFAHYALNPNCQHTPESNLHLAAKQAVIDAKCITTPPLYAREPSGAEVKPPARLRQNVPLDPVHGEFLGLEGIRPDLYAGTPHGPLIIEVFVAHAVDPEKLSRIKALDVAAIEVDLRGFRADHPDTWARAVVALAPRYWLHHPRQAELDAAIAQQIAAREAKEAAERAALAAAQEAAREAARQAREAREATEAAQRAVIAAEQEAQREANRQAREAAEAHLQAERERQRALTQQQAIAEALARDDALGRSQRCEICRKPHSPFGFGPIGAPNLWACRDHREQVDARWSSAR